MKIPILYLNSFHGTVIAPFISNHRLFSSIVLLPLHHQCLTYLSKLKLDYSLQLYHSKRNEHLPIFLKNLKMRRFNDKDDIQRVWSTIDCNFDRNIEFYCNGRLPVFNEWTSPSAKDVFNRISFNQNKSFRFSLVFPTSLVGKLSDSCQTSSSKSFQNTLASQCV